jgi:hypothetical protein
MKAYGEIGSTVPHFLKLDTRWEKKKKLIFTPDHFTLENSRVPIEWEAGLISDALKKKLLTQSGIKALLLGRPIRRLDTIMAKSIYRG